MRATCATWNAPSISCGSIAANRATCRRSRYRRSPEKLPPEKLLGRQQLGAQRRSTLEQPVQIGHRVGTELVEHRALRLLPLADAGPVGALAGGGQRQLAAAAV